MTLVYRSISLLAVFAALTPAQVVDLRPAPFWRLPVVVDSNTPSFWWDGEIRLFSSAGDPQLHRGPDVLSLGEPASVELGGVPTPAWVESVWIDSDGTLFAWYHHEVTDVCPGTTLTMPMIGAAVSWDGGATLHDLGFVLEAGAPPDCLAANGYFAGGHGDFSVAFDPASGYFYFLFSNYGGAPQEQGVAVARLAYADRWAPVGAVWKYHQGSWTEAGLKGRVTPVFPARAAWQGEDPDSYWGPSVHWNTYLQRHVVLLNRACCEPGWPQEGIYLSMTADISDPAGWSPPAQLMEGGGWYPHVFGLGPGETSSEAGQTVRLFLGSDSQWELHFEREPEPTVQPLRRPPPRR